MSELSGESKAPEEQLGGVGRMEDDSGKNHLSLGHHLDSSLPLKDCGNSITLWLPPIEPGSQFGNQKLAGGPGGGTGGFFRGHEEDSAPCLSPSLSLSQPLAVCWPPLAIFSCGSAGVP